jgi:hypothetical protein
MVKVNQKKIVGMAGDNLGHSSPNPPTPPTCWIVIYYHFRHWVPETKLFMETFEMFHSPSVYQQILYVWDSSQDGDSLEEYLLPHIPPDLAHYFLFLDLETEAKKIKRASFDPTSSKSKRYTDHPEYCFDRTPGYCGMLYYKTQMDVLVEIAAIKYTQIIPDIVAISDGDVYWQTLPVTGNLIDNRGRVILLGINVLLDMYRPAVLELLQLPPGSAFINGMVTFPIPLWFDTFANMRDKILELHHRGGDNEDKSKNHYPPKNTTVAHDTITSHTSPTTTTTATTWFHIYRQLTNPLCEFCLMATYASLYEPERYRFSINPAFVGAQPMSNTSVFRDDSNQSAPTIRMTVHDRVGLMRSTLPIVKGCCLTYNLSLAESNGKCVYDVQNFTDLTEEDHTTHAFPYMSSTLLMDHHERVWQTLKTTRSPEANARGKHACQRHIFSLP